MKHGLLIFPQSQEHITASIRSHPQSWFHLIGSEAASPSLSPSGLEIWEEIQCQTGQCRGCSSLVRLLR